MDEKLNEYLAAQDEFLRLHGEIRRATARMHEAQANGRDSEAFWLKQQVGELEEQRDVADSTKLTILNSLEQRLKGSR